jgi:hypothetical protein
MIMAFDSQLGEDKGENLSVSRIGWDLYPLKGAVGLR